MQYELEIHIYIVPSPYSYRHVFDADFDQKMEQFGFLFRKRNMKNSIVLRVHKTE